MSERMATSELAAYAIVHPDGPPFSDLPPHEQFLWRKAFATAQAVASTVVHATVDVGLNETSFNYARSMLGGTPADKAHLIGSCWSITQMVELRDKYGCRITEVPPGALKTGWTWIMVTGDGLFWSAPTD